ncbi:heterogeneous nuclear ribonucleoprotein D-like [Anneissia japonica]|uniref:heterogeneous nuclear ribonucleoprotein D-like n=1 Tax=Anneissia japonica TaxID=1529436 RepID=UPI0014258844|nr:heterogeneous nuclear ribonucleoprotein D-like [Anneissia japonica]
MAGTEYQTEDFSQDPASEASFIDPTQASAEQQSNGASLEQKLAAEKRISASKHVDDGRKIFVGALSWETNDKSMKDHFSQFGAVAEVEIKRDTEGKSRGFAFVLFEDASSVSAVLSKNDHIIDNKLVDAKPARAQKKQEPVVENKKIFIGGLAPTTTIEIITDFFAAYGAVEEVVLPDDKVTRKKRGFGFVTFKEQEGVDKVMADSVPGQKTFVTLDNQQVEVKPAVPRDQQENMKAQRAARGRGRGRGGAMGGYRGGYNQGDYGYGNSGGYGYGGGYNDGSYSYDSYSNNFGNYGYDQSGGGYSGQSGYGAGYNYDGYNSQGYSQGYNQGSGPGGGGGYGKWNQGNRSGRGGGGYHPYNR